MLPEHACRPGSAWLSMDAPPVTAASPVTVTTAG
jgi:hypothetical protein